jgi:hypothetical protein
MMMAEFEEFSTFHFIVITALGGAPTEEEALKEYLRRRMQKGVRYLSATADVFGRGADQDASRLKTRKGKLTHANKGNNNSPAVRKPDRDRRKEAGISVVANEV